MLRAHDCVSGLVAFGLGHLFLSRVEWGVVAAIVLVGLGAAGKIVVHALLEKHCRNSKTGDR